MRASPGKPWWHQRGPQKVSILRRQVACRTIRAVSGARILQLWDQGPHTHTHRHEQKARTKQREDYWELLVKVLFFHFSVAVLYVI